MLVLLFGELDSVEFSERPFVSDGEASREVLFEKTGPSSKLVTGRMEAIRLGVALEPFGTEVEGRGSDTGDCCILASGSTMASRPAFLVLVGAGDAELRLGLGDLDKSSEARPEATESAVPGREEDSLLRVSLLDMSFRMMGDMWMGVSLGEGFGRCDTVKVGNCLLSCAECNGRSGPGNPWRMQTSNKV